MRSFVCIAFIVHNHTCDDERDDCRPDEAGPPPRTDSVNHCGYEIGCHYPEQNSPFITLLVLQFGFCGSDCREARNGSHVECDEGNLEWIKKSDFKNLEHWEGDLIFLDLLEKNEPFFSLKLIYRIGTLKEAVLNGKKIR